MATFITSRIPARYQDCYQNETYEVVLVFCDTEKEPHEQCVDIKRKINEFHDVDSAADEAVIFANPCTMQIIIKHWTDENIKSPAKKVNALLIEKCTDKGRADQIKRVMEQIIAESYQDMQCCVSRMKDNDAIIGSSNFSRFMGCFEGDATWMDKINHLCTCKRFIKVIFK